MSGVRMLFAAAAILLGIGGALAQGYPNKPIRIIVPNAPGGGVDVVSRMIATKLSESLKQPVVVENRPGAGGNIGANAVAKAAPDGYTLLAAPVALAISPSIYRKLQFDPMKDLAPVTQVYATSLILVVNANLPANSVASLVALAKAQPGRLNYGSSGEGGSPHLAAELFKSMTDTSIAHIPYKGIAPISTALLADEVQMAFTVQVGILPHVKSGKMRPLAVTGKTRSPLLPDVPTMAEAGVRDFELPDWMGLFAPAGTPADIVARLQGEVAKIIAQPEIRDHFRGIGYEPVGSTPEQFDAKFKEDHLRFAKIIRDARIPLQD